jgi:hypothetical protein
MNEDREEQLRFCAAHALDLWVLNASWAAENRPDDTLLSAHLDYLKPVLVKIVELTGAADHLDFPVSHEVLNSGHDTRAVFRSDGRVVLVDCDDPNDDATIREALENP